eukprot:CAMPEP_0175112640 /NCGR_PEP_ID=MMETSP0086_2-20121207/15621_1 /TAXON_ID=136419 /ORGANISM="Unknown Unknown, Strain D1" /LENGTH=35 /DNA_ID= /DNA_START= /DNA_END= /DNA_ORIENTATION=
MDNSGQYLNYLVEFDADAPFAALRFSHPLPLVEVP